MRKIASYGIINPNLVSKVDIEKRLILMRRTFCLILLLCLTSELQASLYDGCMGYYSFNNSLVDSSLSDQTAESSGSLSFVDGQKGQGVYLDGIEDHLSLGVFNFIDRLTICFWMKLPHQPESSIPIISKIDDINTGQGLLKHSFYIKVLGQANGHRLYFAVSEDGEQPSDIISHTIIEKEVWYYIVARFQAGKLVLYINGEKDSEAPISVQQLFTSAVPVVIGTMMINGEASQPFANAIIDELRLYNRNLSEDEIQELFEKRSGPEILYHEPNGILNQPVSYIDIHFNVPIISKLLTAEDLLVTSPDQHTIIVNKQEKLNETTYRFSFDPLNTNGTYHLQVGPNIFDHAGNALNQDQDLINGEASDIYSGHFQLNAIPDNVLFVNMKGSLYDPNGRNIYEALLETDTHAIYINLESSAQEELLINRLSQSSTEYQQVWIYAKSSYDGKYSKAIDAIRTWFKAKQDRQIICDGRIRASFWMGNWQTLGKELASNYYMNLKLNGGGLLLAADHPDDQSVINAICEQIEIASFGAMTTYDSVESDRSCLLMSYPNQLDAILESPNEASLVPTGKQANGLHLYCVAWNPEDINDCNISTSILPFIPLQLTAQVNGNAIELSWQSAQPEINVSYYNVYLSQKPFSNISGLQPYQKITDKTSLTFSSLIPGQTYYMTATAVDLLDNERKKVTTVSATTERDSQTSDSGGGGCFLNSLLGIY